MGRAGIYNLGTGRGTRCWIPTVSAGPRRGDPVVLLASPERARRELQWEPMHGDLQEIIGAAWEWLFLHGASAVALKRYGNSI